MEIPGVGLSKEDAEALARLWDEGMNVRAKVVTNNGGIEVVAWKKGEPEPPPKLEEESKMTFGEFIYKGFPE